jgi:uncharacterized protein (DUF488 family)
MPPVLTIGHSTRSLEEFLGLLTENGVRELIDVRRFPGSRRYPHFSRDRLATALGEAGIAYRHEPDLGGHREPRPDSPHTAWRLAAFRGYADHMDAPAFQSALARLRERSAAASCAVMCAEALPERCHRQLLADALVVRGTEVRHILGPARTEAHAVHPAARALAGGRLVYDLPRLPALTANEPLPPRRGRRARG